MSSESPRATTVTPPSAEIRQQAADRLAGLATPPGALGRLGEIAVWFAAANGNPIPDELTNIRLAIFAGDHGVAQHGVSAFPSSITPAMVQMFLAGKAGVSALARAHDVHVRVLDLCVDDDLDGAPADVQQFKVRRSTGAIHLTDALTDAEFDAAYAAGRTVAAEEIAAGAQLLISGDMGIGNTTPAAAMIAVALGVPASDVTGRGTGIDDAALQHKIGVIQTAIDRVGARAQDPLETLKALSSADLAATTGYMVAAAEAGVPVLLDGLMSVACALTAERIAPGARAWFMAGHRSTEPGQSMALDALGLTPLVDLGMRLGEGSGAVAAVPVLRSAVALLREVALLSEVMGE